MSLQQFTTRDTTCERMEGDNSGHHGRLRMRVTDVGAPTVKSG